MKGQRKEASGSAAGKGSYKPSLRITISTIFIALFLVTISTVLYTSYRGNERSILAVAEDLLDGNALLVCRKTRDYLEPAASIAALNAALAKRHIVDLQDVVWWQRLCAEYVRAYPQLREVNFGSEAGNIYGAERREGGVVNRYQITRHDPGAEMGQVDYRFFDENDRPVGQKQVERAYDPRTRPWYVGAVEARGTFWTEPYIFITDKMQVGITAAYPLFDGDGRSLGVMSCDMEMAEISRFLKTQVVGKTGEIFIINKDAKVVAHPELEKIVKKEGDTVETITLSEMGPHWLADAYDRHLRTGQDTLTVTDPDNGQRMIVAFRPLPRDQAEPWKIVLVAPEDDFIAGLKANNRFTLLLSLGILVGSIFLIASLAHQISKRLERLTCETDRLRRFDLDGDIRVTSHIAEIERIAGAVSRLQGAMRAFRKYVPAQLVRSLIETGEEVRLGGENREITIFFSDIRDFTSLSEQTDPNLLMTHLSEYLEELTTIILSCRGTIDKYIGDGIMAFWGAPVPLDDHALSCCRAAVRCVKRLRELNRRWAEEGKPALHTRIGIHTGETIVGNIGSSDRMNYTLLGDSVNLASRLEGVNKTYGTSILISETTHQRVMGKFVTRPIDFVVVKGKRQTVKVFEILDDMEEPANESVLALAKKFNTAFGLFHSGQWALAEESLLELQRDYPEDEATAALLHRLRECQRLPSRKTWWRKRMDDK